MPMNPIKNKQSMNRKRLRPHVVNGNSDVVHILCPVAPVVQRLDNFIQWISHYPTVSICAKISVFRHLQVNMHTLITAKFGSVRKPRTTFNVQYILEPE